MHDNMLIAAKAWGAHHQGKSSSVLSPYVSEGPAGRVSRWGQWPPGAGWGAGSGLRVWSV